MSPDEQIEARANSASDFTDFEERCGRCREEYAAHETKPWMGTIATVCPDGKGFFEVQGPYDDL